MYFRIFMIIVIISVLIKIGEAILAFSIKKDSVKQMKEANRQKKLQNEKEMNRMLEAAQEHDRLSLAFVEERFKQKEAELRKKGYTDAHIEFIKALEVIEFRVNIFTPDPEKETSEEDKKLREEWLAYYREHAKLAWVLADKKAKAAQDNYEAKCAEYRRARLDKVPDLQLSKLQNELEMSQRFMEQQMRETQITMDMQREAVKAATGIEFGGYNPDLNLNPGMHQLVDTTSHMVSSPEFDSTPNFGSMNDFGGVGMFDSCSFGGGSMFDNGSSFGESGMNGCGF